MGGLCTFTVWIKGRAVDIILFTNAGAGYHASAHTHSGHEFHYIHRGSARLWIGAEGYPLEAGGCCLVPKGVFHRIEMVSDTVSRFTLLINPQVPELFGKLPPLTAFQAEGELEMLLTLLIRALTGDQTTEGFESYLHSGVTMLLIKLLERLAPGEPQRSAPVPARSEEAMKQEILSYVANDLAGATLTGLSKLLHMSPRQVSRFLEEKMGESFSSLLRKHRIEHAKALMISGHVSLEEIAFLSGYQSYKGFHSAFCKYTGVNPKAYKQSLTAVR